MAAVPPASRGSIRERFRIVFGKKKISTKKFAYYTLQVPIKWPPCRRQVAKHYPLINPAK